MTDTKNATKHPTVSQATTWHPASWQNFPVTQHVAYPEQQKLIEKTKELSELPPLVTEGEIEQLRLQLAQAATGKQFILQGGDCAESFIESDATTIVNKLKILLQMSLILLHGLRKPIIRIGRIAGQYAKPRSADTETRDGVTMPCYRGDLINGADFTLESRIPDPQRLLAGYYHSASTLNYLRALLDSGFADLQHPENWDLNFVEHSQQAAEYHTLVKSIRSAFDFIKTINGLQSSSLVRVDFFTSHEALHLPYEQPLTRQGKDGQWYNFGTHFPWIGMRTADLNGAHIEYLRGIANPVAVKVGPNATAEWIRALILKLNPNNIPGKLTLISRFGAEQVANILPRLIKAVQETEMTVVWSCDPMHGNTHTTKDGIKTRHFDAILSELQQSFNIHHQLDSHLGGVHFELTGENVTECLGGARGLAEIDLKRAYKSLVDPRLNYEQSLEMAMRISRMGKTEGK